jgi:hypothetical protein
VSDETLRPLPYEKIYKGRIGRELYDEAEKLFKAHLAEAGDPTTPLNPVREFESVFDGLVNDGEFLQLDEEALRKEKDGAYAVFTADTMSSLTARRVERRNGDLLSEDLEIRFVPSEQS